MEQYVYVVCFIDVDRDHVRKSSGGTLGVFTTEKAAQDHLDDCCFDCHQVIQTIYMGGLKNVKLMRDMNLIDCFFNTNNR